MSHRLSIGQCAVALLLLCAPAGAESFCDPHLEKKSTSPMAYRDRGNRCEGLYAQEVSALSLDVRSLVAGYGSFDPGKDQDLVLAWTPPPGAKETVRLRAFSFRQRHYFRMDTAVPAARTSFGWPTDLLASEELLQEELGMIAWMDLPGPGGTTRKVYLPLRAGNGAGGQPEDGYEIAVVPSKRLKTVHVTVSQLDPFGEAVVKTLRRNEELGNGFYHSNEPTFFSLGKLGAAGFYRVEITATPDSGAAAVKQKIELYHPGD